MTRQHLDVSEGSTHGGDLTSGVGYEGSSSRVAGAAVEPEFAVPPTEQVHDDLRGGPGCPLGGNNIVTTAFLLEASEGFSEVGAHGDDPSTPPSLGGGILEADGGVQIALGVGHHRPLEIGDLLGSETRPDGQEEDDPVPDRVEGLGQVSEDGVDLTPREGLRLFAEGHGVSPDWLWNGNLEPHYNKFGEYVHR